VIAHEAAHKAAAGRFGGPVSYTYTTGPDGKKYITGGEVPISTPSTSNPEEALRNATQVMKAALAPGDPSGQDIAVAASAAQMAASARAQISSGEGGAKKPGGAKPAASQPAGAPVKDEAPASPEPKAKRAGREREASDAYSAQVSPKGLWTTSRGYDDKIPAIFEELQPGSEVHAGWDKKSAEFEIAA
jgi:hypothetical protein